MAAEMDARSITAASGRTGAVSFITGLAALVPVITIFAATIGAYPISLGQLLAILAGRTSETGGTAATMLLQVRLPRIAAALVVGASLAAGGTVYQGLSRNPHVSPDILGVSTGAGLGAVLGIEARRVRVVVVAAAILTTASVVAISGTPFFRWLLARGWES
jgi:iron complex transport system permease protein